MFSTTNTSQSGRQLAFSLLAGSLITVSLAPISPASADPHGDHMSSEKGAQSLVVHDSETVPIAQAGESGVESLGISTTLAPAPKGGSNLTPYPIIETLPTSHATSCTPDSNGSTCHTVRESCTPGLNYRRNDAAGEFFLDPRAQREWDRGEDMVMQQISLYDPVEDRKTPQGYRCVPVGEAGSIDPASLPPPVITVTLRDLKRMPIDTPIAHAGPERGWLPVNMVNVLYTEADTQELETEVLGTPVRIRAIPSEFHWDLGDGNTITTKNPGKPFPSERISSKYRFEGWYDIILTTTFTGQFSVDGGEWQDIEGSIEIESDPVELFAKSLESRLVNGSEDEDEDSGYGGDDNDEDEEEPWIPERTPDTEGPIDPKARHRRI